MQELIQFQFLRPWWFLGLLPVAWLLWKARQAKNQQGSWQQVIAPQFRALLLGENSREETSVLGKFSLVGLGLIWCLGIIALAGPSLQSVQMPAEKNQQGTVIVLDLSLSMLADDLTPNRLSRVQYKITDLVSQHPELAIGLVGYAGTAHTITPISEDNQTLLGLLPSLNPVIMPRYGSNPLLGFEQAKKLIEGSFINHGHIIWITDDLESNQISAVKTWIQSHDYSFSIMPVGTATGGAVQIPNYGLLKDDNGKIVLPQLPLLRFAELGQLRNVRLAPLVIGNNSLKDLLPPTSISRSQKEPENSKSDELNKAPEKTVIHALDDGPWLLMWLVPLVALVARRGWILSISLPMLLPVGFALSMGLTSALTPTSSFAETELPSFSEVFKSPNQQGYQAWQEQNYSAAEALFEDQQWRASALYRLGKYAEAASLFSKDESAKGFYNYANALAKSGQLEQAKQAYENALKKQPDFTAAEQNLALVKQLLQQQDQQQPQKQDEKQETSKKQNADNAQENKPENEQDNKQDNGEKNSQESSESSQKSNSSSKSGQDSGENKANTQSDNSEKPSENKLADVSDIEDSKKANDALNKPPSAPSPTEKTADNESGSLDKQTENNPEDKQGQATADSAQTIEPEQTDSGLADSKLSTENPDDLADKNKQQSTLDTAASPTAEPTEEEQATQNWLKQIPDQPGVFLKRKFEYQYQQQSSQPGMSGSENNSSNNPSDKQW